MKMTIRATYLSKHDLASKGEIKKLKSFADNFTKSTKPVNISWKILRVSANYSI
jgi:hypothetical protein